MVLFLVLAVALDWGTLATVSRLVFGALTVLALYVGWRGWQAFQDLQRRGTGWTASYLDDIGFTLIALFDGFVIIGALDLGAPVWLVVAITTTYGYHPLLRRPSACGLACRMARLSDRGAFLGVCDGGVRLPGGP
jgi:hypothetical protein